MHTLIHVIILLGVSLFVSHASAAPADATALFAQHCASCHGVDRLGAMGPALLPDNLSRLRKKAAREVVVNGRTATQMPAFGAALDDAQIDALVALIYQPTPTPPKWGVEQIVASRIVHADVAALPAKAKFDADLMNLFIVVEAGDHHVSILDGDKLERIHRFPSRFALHGGPKFSPEGRFVYFASRDGWVSKYDIWNLTLVAEVRAGINTRNLAVSSDGKVVAVANYLPHSLVLLDSDLNMIKVMDVTDREGKTSSRVSAVYDAAPRKSFVAALKDVPEVWEISYDPTVEDIPVGLIHDFKYKEGAFLRGYLNPRRTPLADILDDFFFTQDYSELIGATRVGKKGQVVHLDVRKKIADLDLGGMPHLGSGITWEWQGRTVMASPNLEDGKITVIDVKDWSVVKEIKTLGPGFFMRSHENSRYAWTDSMMSPTARDTLQVIDKETLEVVAQLKPEPGKTLAHIEFTRDGRYAIASLWEDDGALIVYDAVTLKEVKRLPARRPVGKYNLHNKITRSSGTSH
ncbi:MAG: cytochrome C oxidase Cbb3 [Denitromonas halophila]|nr:MAG: cytochrome C oxidase Cbb3 [Denitromonas halophila]TVT68422.1 MAG: cytochrome C oxidase Cbb3 [Denitromonas halophila]TVT77781.1 MAG: cytochrome C oxidase Cbb3 [Denitromonas halophila]